MFTLSGRFLEDGENLFQDFWSQFSIYFIRFSERNYLKKGTDLRAVSGPDSSQPLPISRAAEPTAAQPAPLPPKP